MICGVDEAGRGPVFGPLVIAGVTFENEVDVKVLKVRDSKQLTPLQRKTLAKTIKERASNFELLVISASDIDDMRKVMTLNEIEVYAFSTVIKKLKPQQCFVDAADVKEKRFGQAILANLSFAPEMISKHKADAIYPVVGAASILAKTTRDEHIIEIEKKLHKKLDLPLGSGYPADPITISFLKAWLERYGKLPPFVRHSWKTTHHLLSQSKTKTLDNF